MMNFENSAPANDNADIYSKLEIDPATWERQCNEIQELANELAELAAEAKSETGGRAQVTRVIEMAQIAIALQGAVSQPEDRQA